MARMVSSSASEGPGPVISRGFTERRIFRRSIASGTANSFVEWLNTLPWTGRLRPLHIRRGRFIDQRGDRLVGRQHLLAVAAEPADRDRAALGFPFADHQKCGDFRQRMLAD